MKSAVKTVISKPRLGSRGRPEESRAAILQAAVVEFSREGAAGARTDAIARAAGVNKALLYYYFKNKERLYAAVLDQVFGGLKQTIEKALSNDLPPGRSCWPMWARTLTTSPPIISIPGSRKTK